MSSWADRLDAAVRTWERGEPAEAAALLREIAASGDPHAAPEASHLLARVLDDLGDLDGAVAAYRSVVDTGHPVFAQRAAFMLGTLLVSGQEWGSAHRYLAIASDGADPDTGAMADGALAQVLSRLGDRAAARAARDRGRSRSGDETVHALIDEMTAGLDLDGPPPPAGPGAREAAQAAFERAERLAEEGSPAAEAVFRQLLASGDPELVSQAAFRLYSIYAQRSEFAAAREVVEQALAVGHPRHAGMARHLLGSVLVDFGEYAAALHEQRLAAEDPGPQVRLPALLAEARLTAHLGDDDAALAILRRVAASGHPRFAVEARACLVQVHAEAGRDADALDECRAVLHAGEPEHAATVVVLLSGLLDRAAGDRLEDVRAVLRDAAGHPDPDVAYKARMLLAHAAVQEPLADPVAEQALQDTDGGLERLRAGDLAGARALLRRAADSDVPPHCLRAGFALALLELGEDDADQADELLSHAADSEDEHQSFIATLYLHLLRSPRGAGHPVLRATMEHQRHGRERGARSWREAAQDADPDIAALATAMLAQLLTGFGLDITAAAPMFEEAAGSGRALALSFAALAYDEPLVQQDRAGEAVALLRRAAEHGDPVLAPWVALRLGTVLAGHDEDGTGLAQARSAFEAALRDGRPGVRADAETGLLQVLERLDDLAAVCAVHEREVAAGDPLQAPRNAWLLGVTRVRMDDLDAARAAFARVPESHPELGPSGAFARLLLDRDPGAAGSLAPVRALGAGDARFWMACKLAMETAHAWQRAGDAGAADEGLALVLDAGHPDFVQEAAGYLGALRRESGDLPGAIAAWERADGDDAWIASFARHGIGACLRELGDLDGAADAFRAVLDGPDADHARDAGQQLGEVLAASGRRAEAREVFERLSGDGALLDLATALKDAGDAEGAAGAYLEAQGADDVEVVMVASFNLAILLEERGDLTGAAAATVRAVAAAEAEGDDDVAGQALHNLGHLLAGTGDADGAREAFERAAVTGTAQGALSLVALGDHLVEAGEAGEARAVFERAAQSGDPSVAALARHRMGSDTLEDRAWRLLTDGDREGARAAFAELHGSADLAALVLALFDGEPGAAGPLLAGLAARPEHAAAATDLVRKAAMSLQAGGDRSGARALLALNAEHGDPVQAGWAMIAMAAIAADEGDLREAERLTLRAAESPGADPELAGTAWDNLRILRLRRDDVPTAIEAGRRAVDSGHPAAVAGAAAALGELLEERGDLAGAREVLARGSRADHPDAVHCLRALMFVLHEQDDAEALAEAAGRAAETGDAATVAQAHYLLATVHERGGDVDAAVAAYWAAAGAGDAATGAVARVDLARALEVRGSDAEARLEYEAALGSGEPVAVAVAGNRLGELRSGEDDLAGAAAAFGAAAAADASHDPAGRIVESARVAMQSLAGLAHRAHGAGDHEAAIRALSLVARAGAYDGAVELTKLLAGACTSEGDLDAARRYCQCAIGFDPGKAPAREADMANMLAANGEKAEARVIFERLEGSADPDIRAYAAIRLVEMLEEAGDQDAAYAVAERQAGDADGPASAMMANMLGFMQSERGDTDEALRTFRAGAADGDPTAMYMLAQTLVEAGRAEEGREVYQGIADGGSDLADRAVIAVGRTFHDEDEDAAREWYLRAVDAADGHLAALAAMYLGALAKRHRDLDGALPWYTRVIDSGDSEAGMAAAHLGELCYWRGDRDGVVRYYEQTLALSEDPELVGEAAYRIGEIRHRDGDLDAARTALERAAGSGDDAFAPQARELLARLGGQHAPS